MKKISLLLIIITLLTSRAITVELCIGRDNTCNSYIEVAQEVTFTLNIIINNHPIEKDIMGAQFYLKFDPNILEITQQDAIPDYPYPSRCINHPDYARCFSQLKWNNNFPLYWATYPLGVDTTNCKAIENIKNYFSNDYGEVFYQAFIGFESDGMGGLKFNLQTTPVTLVSIEFKAKRSTCYKETCSVTELQFVSDYSEVYLYSQGGKPTTSVLSNLKIRVNDTIAPHSYVNQLPKYQKNRVFKVSWKGEDKGGSGVKYYNIQYKEEDALGRLTKNWTDWLVNFEGTEGVFDQGKLGHTYYFRSRATDYANNTEVENNPAGDTSTKILMYVTAALPNPARPEDIIISIKDKYDILKGTPPQVEVQQSGANKIAVTMKKVSATTYTGIYRLLPYADGVAQIIVNQGEEIEYFTVVKVKPFMSYNIDSFDKRISIKIDEGTFAEDIFVTIFEKDEEELINNELIKISKGYKIAPTQQKFKKVSTLSFYYDDELLITYPVDKIGIFLKEQDRLQFVDSKIENNKISAHITSFGDYYLCADITPPKVELLEIENNQNPNIRFIIKDDGAGINKDSIEILLNNTKVIPTYDERTNILNYKVNFNLQAGDHTLVIKVKDNLNNLTINRHEFKIKPNPDELKINSFYPLPNPSRGNVYFYYNLNSNPTKIKIRIFNIQGGLIKEKEFFKTDNASTGSIKGDEIINNLPNGVYLYQAIISNQTHQVKKVGKLVILK